MIPLRGCFWGHDEELKLETNVLGARRADEARRGCFWGRDEGLKLETNVFWGHDARMKPVAAVFGVTTGV